MVDGNGTPIKQGKLLEDCVNPDQDPDDVKDQCEDKCTAQGYAVQFPGPELSDLDAIDCTIETATPTPFRCLPGSTSQGLVSSEISQGEIRLDGTARVTVSIPIGNDVRGTATGTGSFRYTIGDCVANECPMAFQSLDLTVPRFRVANDDVIETSADISANIQNDGYIFATWNRSTKEVRFDPNAFKLSVNFTVDDDHGSATIRSAQAVTGILDPDANTFSLNLPPLRQGDASVVVAVGGTFVNRPPKAAVSPAAGELECNGPDGATVTFDSAPSTDPENNLSKFYWTLDGTTKATGRTLAATLPLGAHTVELTVLDPQAALDMTTQSYTVVDRSVPTISAPPDVVISTCVNAKIGQATASGQCGVRVTNDAPAKFPLGTTVVTWTATTPGGNTVTAKQRVTAILGDDPSCCPVGTNIIVGTDGHDTLHGTAGSDCILGRGGNDNINTKDGDDFVSGGAGNDTIVLGAGTNFAWGGAGDDRIHGGIGNDTIDGGDGRNVCTGAPGNNKLVNCGDNR
jgi:Ca2+-binding RTX toxin-like protein